MNKTKGCLIANFATVPCAERKSYLPERFLFASSPVRSLRSVTWLRRALIHKAQHCTGRN
ncbi:hypothetical protein EIZ97_23005 [Escherichia coli]|nr:hypothetical protein [Escherichia coli]